MAGQYKCLQSSEQRFTIFCVNYNNDVVFDIPEACVVFEAEDR